MFVGSWFGGAALCRRVHRGQIALETAGAAAARANLLLFRAIAMRSEHGKAAVTVDAAEQTLLDGLEDKNPKYLRGDDDRGCPNSSAGSKARPTASPAATARFTAGSAGTSDLR